MVSGSYGQADGAGRLLAGRYRVVARLGRGGMGVVWLAVDEVLGREVAVKELRAYTDSAGPELADLRLRMQREARAAARVRHRGVIVVHDIAEVDGRPLIVMELVDGPSLDDLLRERGTLPVPEAARVGAEVVDALAAAHRVGVLHRDVKPGNILLDRSGRVVLTDFGIATMAEPGDGSATHLTGSGELVGSLDYLAPERAKGAAPGPASDIWALGAALYAAVEGALPFSRTSTFSTLTAIVDEPLPEPRRAGPLAPVLRRLMDKRPEARPDAEEAFELLRAVARQPAADTPTTALREPARPVAALSAGLGTAPEATEEPAGKPAEAAAQETYGGLAHGSAGEGGQEAAEGSGQEAGEGRGQEAAEGPGQEPGEGAGQEAVGAYGQHAVEGRGQEPAEGPGQESAGGYGQHAVEGSGQEVVEAYGKDVTEGRGPARGTAGVLARSAAEGTVEGMGEEPAAEPDDRLVPVAAAGLSGEAGILGSGLVPARGAGPEPRPGALDGPSAPARPGPRSRRRARLLVVAAVAVVLTATGLTVALRNERGQTARPDAGPPAPTMAGASASLRGTDAGHPADANPVGQGEETGAVPSDGATHTAGDVPAGLSSTAPSSARTSAPASSGGSGTAGATPTATATATATDPTGPDPVCASAGDGMYTCQVHSAAKSYTADGTKVGKVLPGAHEFSCQADLGRRATHGASTNVWWARTDDDSGNTGVYISDVYIEGGTDDEPLPGLPVC
ncbi:protein kinase [Streptomyces sp. NPDC051987]|uniref:serine/threonine-protein kinase n=1 Tax=Streptomyces sp. NPDC051987 TaxID=3155808 RepID=UPI00341C1471